MRRGHFYALLVLLADGLPACTPGCGPDADQEPRLTIYVSSSSGQSLTARSVATSIRGVGLTQELLDPARLHPTDPDQATSSVSFNVPYSLAADQTRYVLTSATRRDTLTVNYQRVFSYKDDDCGYWVDVQPPAGFAKTTPTGLPNLALGARSTLGKVSSVYYEGTQLSSNALTSYYTKSDITVSITLP
ncbi:hypothetical protein FAES_1107 [Fibrella aestuarina BUZ 2]|uniref:Uncharacterized protein n=1 Tax=Fibrella aestuarina BUZ 2 TaxID=1166018 RepID=I0K4R4_9BACT|nr:hypothetical protein [Fibrella aestuarina]CCG99117.1 hypothetical protein FAES_1107 [Fibrella aestuarina BUZ 2]